MRNFPFYLCLMSVPRLTSAQRHGLKIAVEQKDKRDLVAEVAALYERPPFAPEKVDASLLWSCNKLPGPCFW